MRLISRRILDKLHVKSGKYVVCAKADDPIARQARARLIWMSNTAQATQNLGISTLLVGCASELPFKPESLAGQFAIERLLKYWYGIAADFDFQVLYTTSKEKDRIKTLVEVEYARYILPFAGIVHTRDPIIAAECAKRKINYILEYHDEHYQNSFTNYDALRLS